MCVVGGERGTSADNYVAISCVCTFGVRLFEKPLKLALYRETFIYFCYINSLSS